jgi:hypothetical protein
MRPFVHKALGFFFDNLPGFVFVGLIVVAAGACHSLAKGCEKFEAEQKQKALESGVEVQTDVYIEGVGQYKVIHDKNRQVTCWHMNSDISCVPDKDVKR